MEGQRWEYCQLRLLSSEVKEEGGILTKKKQIWSYSCHINYLCPDGEVIFLKLADLDKPLPFNPFNRVIGLLGAAGWEVVSIQHGTEGGIGIGNISWRNIVAYFKRPCLPGRAVNDPELSV